MLLMTESIHTQAWNLEKLTKVLQVAAQLGIAMAEDTDYFLFHLANLDAPNVLLAFCWSLDLSARRPG